MQSQQLAHTIDQLLRKKQDRNLRSVLVKEEPYIIAEALDSLDMGAVKTFGLLPPEVQAEVALALNETSREHIIPRLSDFTVARFLYFLDENDGADIIQILPVDKRPAVLEKLKDPKRRKIEKLLTYDPETAGGLMDLNFISVRESDTILDVTRQAQEVIGREKQTPTIVVVNENHKPTGIIPYKSLITHRQTEPAFRALVPLPLITVSADQERVLELLLDERADVAGVTDGSGNLVGIMRVADLLRVVQSEATEDIFALAGVSREETILGSARSTFLSRYKWLIINVFTAMLGAFVVSQFENTIAQLAILAAYMPMVGGLGGNAATQALAISVRGLALGEISWENSRRIIAKEAATGIGTGLVVGLTSGLLAFMLTQHAGVAIVLGVAMVINIFMSGIVGSLVPLFLHKAGVDPAVASSIFVTAAIDIFGFAVFLGIATMFLL